MTFRIIVSNKFHPLQVVFSTTSISSVTFTSSLSKVFPHPEREGGDSAGEKYPKDGRRESGNINFHIIFFWKFLCVWEEGREGKRGGGKREIIY